MGEKKQKSFVLPKDILSKINECSSGGFVLFTFDEFGNPHINSQFDSMTHAVAMQYYISNWLQAIDDINSDIMKSNISGGRNRPDDDSTD